MAGTCKESTFLFLPVVSRSGDVIFRYCSKTLFEQCYDDRLVNVFRPTIQSMFHASVHIMAVCQYFTKNNRSKQIKSYE